MVYATFALALLLRTVLCDLDLVVLHNNDMHGRFEETERNSGTCKEEHRNRSCIGGFARTAHEVRRFRKAAQEGKGPAVLFLNAGDSFVGTTWYSLFTWNITVEMVNLLQPDVICLGNHEFDSSTAGLAPFVDKVSCPVVAANLNFTLVPDITKVQRSAVLERGGRKIGVIGYLTPDTKSISSPGKTIFYDEVESILGESERLEAQGVDVILALGHSGYDMDMRIAKEVPLVDAVIGGHTNTFLWNGAAPDAEEVEDVYPKVVTQRSGKRVPVVQAYAYTKYLGVLNLKFDDKGDLISFAGQPIFLDSSIPQEPDVLAQLEIYRPGIIAINYQIIGQSRVVLDGNSEVCRRRECNFGNLIADAYAYYKRSVSASGRLPIGLQNGGGIRNTIEPGPGGDVSYGELLGAIPFNNQIISLKLNGSNIVASLEIGARSNGETSRGEFLQVSGLRVLYDMSRPALKRVQSVLVRCDHCAKETYEPIVPDKYYDIVTTSFLASEGGDNHYILKEEGLDKYTEDLMDVNVVEWYFNVYSPVEPKVEARIRFVGEENSFAISIKSNELLMLSVSVILGYLTH